MEGGRGRGKGWDGKKDEREARGEGGREGGKEGGREGGRRNGVDIRRVSLSVRNPASKK